MRFKKMSNGMIFPTLWYVQPTKAQISMRIRTLISAFAGHLNILCLSGYCMASQNAH